jgi:branched-chain amino acid transport system ATP-binding protein
MPDLRAPLLSVNDLQSWYGESHILHGVSFDVHQGEVVTLLGRNGAGKTTLVLTIMGFRPEIGALHDLRGHDRGWVPVRDQASVV